MGKFTVTRNDFQIHVNAPVDDVYQMLQRSSSSWPWKSQWHQDLASGERLFMVKGHFLKDNAAAAECEIIHSAEGGAVIQVAGSRGNLMENIGGNVFNVGVAKFQKKVMEQLEKSLREM